VEKIRAGPPPVLRPPRRLAEDPGPGPPTSLGSTRTPAPLGGSLSRPATQPSSSLALIARVLRRRALSRSTGLSKSGVPPQITLRRNRLASSLRFPLPSGPPRRLSASRPAFVSRLSVVSLDRSNSIRESQGVNNPPRFLVRSSLVSPLNHVDARCCGNGISGAIVAESKTSWRFR